MLLFEDYREKILEGIRVKYPEVESSDVAIDDSGHGDFTFRTFRLLKQKGLKPDDVYNTLRKIFDKSDYIDSIEIVKGYINFSIKPEKLFSVIAESMKRTGEWPDTFQDPERVSVEHTSANPTGPLHIGRSRNSILGDSIARLLSRYGYRVTRQYFVNDSGKQVMALYYGYLKYGQGAEPTLDTLLTGYQKVYQDMEKDPTIEKEIEELIKSYERGDEELIKNVRKVTEVGLSSVVDVLSRLDIKNDDFTWESDFIRTGEIEDILKSLSGELKVEDGALYLELPNERKIFLKRSDGTSLYFARDIAYHLYKTLNYDWIIDVLGEDHKDHGNSMNYVLKELLDIQQKLDFVFYGFISLESGKMSTRKGNVVTLDDLIERTEEEAYNIVKEKRPELSGEALMSISKTVAASSIRFNIIRVNANKPMVFRWSEALNFEGDSAPYIMYSYARASSILKKAEGEEIHEAQQASGYNDSEKKLIREMYLYPFNLVSAKDGLRPDVITNYALRLVRAFNDFYMSCPVLTAEAGERSKRLNLVSMYKTILEDVSSVIGIQLIEEM